jgi:ABC-type transport system involved in multi-copper enzyme maturation permease subunit
MSDVLVVAAHALRESLRRRVFAVVVCLTLAFGALYAWGTDEVFQDVNDFGPNQFGLDPRVLAGATILGLAMFGTLFLGTVLAIFLTLGAVRGDAERGLLQPLVVRPLGRATFLAARFVGAAGVCVAYVLGLYGITVLVTGLTGGWWPDRIVTPGIELAAAVVVVVSLSLLGSVFLSATANGIAVFMVFGAGLVAGLLGQIAETLPNPSGTLDRISRISSYLLPFEALYQDALNNLTSDTVGFTRYVLRLGPFGGAQVGGGLLVPWTLAYLAVVGLVASIAFRRTDL